MTLNEKFEYHVEDLDCLYCQYYKPENRDKKTGCGLDVCRFEDIRQDAVANNRIERAWLVQMEQITEAQLAAAMLIVNNSERKAAEERYYASVAECDFSYCMPVFAQCSHYDKI